MIVGVLLYNEKTHEILFRSPHDYGKDTVESFIQSFVKAPKDTYGSFFDHLNYVYTSRKGFFICVITSFPVYVVQKLLQTYESSITSSMIENLCLIDDTINSFTFLALPSSVANQYLAMESQEEKLHDLMTKNKEEELYQRMKDVRKKETPDIFDTHLEKVRELELEIKKPVEKTVKREAKDIFREKKKKVEVHSDIQVIIKEKLKIVMDKESKVKSCEIDGDLSLVIGKDEFSACWLKIEPEIDLKYSPNLEKGLTKEGVLRTTKKFPVNKSLALVKWKKSKMQSLPISFTFWPSDLENGRYQIMFEISAEEDLKDLIFCFSKEKIKDVVVEAGNAEIKEFLEWNVGTLEKGQSETLEFSCSCFSPSDVFPINLYFTGNFSASPVRIESIKVENDAVDFDTANVCEVDSFVIVDE